MTMVNETHGGKAVFAKNNPAIIASMATTTFSKKSLGLDTAEQVTTPQTGPTPSNNGTTFAKKPRLGGGKSKKRDIPEGLWTKCPKCSTMVFDKELDENLKVCLNCQHHFPIGSR